MMKINIDKELIFFDFKPVAGILLSYLYPVVIACFFILPWMDGLTPFSFEFWNTYYLRLSIREYLGAIIIIYSGIQGLAIARSAINNKELYKLCISNEGIKGNYFSSLVKSEFMAVNFSSISSIDINVFLMVR
jgi:hypothetical protein